MKTKLAEVTSCSACPFEGWSGYCTKDKSIKCGIEIPDKCRLPDAPLSSSGDRSLMKEKLIDLIKECRATSEARWSPVHGYKSEFTSGESHADDRHAADLEKLVDELPEDAGENCFFRGGHGCGNVRVDVAWKSSK